MFYSLFSLLSSSLVFLFFYSISLSFVTCPVFYLWCSFFLLFHVLMCFFYFSSLSFIRFLFLWLTFSSFFRFISLLRHFHTWLPFHLSFISACSFTFDVLCLFSFMFFMLSSFPFTHFSQSLLFNFFSFSFSILTSLSNMSPFPLLCAFMCSLLLLLHVLLLFFLLSMSFIISLRLSFLKLVFYNLFISLCYVDCYIQFPSSSTCNMTSSAGSNSFNSHFFIFLWQFLVSKLIFFSLAYSL